MWRKASHRNFIHPKCPYPVVISGKTGSDAKPYQERALKMALRISPELHRTLAIKAITRGESINKFIEKSLSK